MSVVAGWRGLGVGARVRSRVCGVGSKGDWTHLGAKTAKLYFAVQVRGLVVSELPLGSLHSKPGQDGQNALPRGHARQVLDEKPQL